MNENLFDTTTVDGAIRAALMATILRRELNDLKCAWAPTSNGELKHMARELFHAQVSDQSINALYHQTWGYYEKTMQPMLVALHDGENMLRKAGAKPQ